MSTYIDLVSGEQQLKTAINSSAGAGDADKLIRTDASGLIDASFMPAGVGERITVTASENLAAGALVNIWNDTTAKAREADATDNSKPADGFVSAAVTLGNPASVIPLYGTQSGGTLTGLTIAAKLYLSTTPGVPTETPPSSAGNVIQFVGFAITATSAFFICNRQNAVEIQ
jgi:hypothetical protein